MPQSDRHFGTWLGRQPGNRARINIVGATPRAAGEGYLEDIRKCPIRLDVLGSVCNHHFYENFIRRSFFGGLCNNASESPLPYAVPKVRH